MYSKLKTSNSIDFWDLPESITSHVHHPWAQICPISEAAVLSLRRNRRWSTRTHREGRIPEWLHNVTNYIPTLHPVEDCHRGGGCQPALGNVDQSHLRSGIVRSYLWHVESCRFELICVWFYAEPLCYGSRKSLELCFIIPTHVWEV